MTMSRMRFVVAFGAAGLFFCLLSHGVSRAADGPNQLSNSDVAAGSFVDSLFDPELAHKSRSKAKRKPSRRISRERIARRRAELRASDPQFAAFHEPTLAEGAEPPEAGGAAEDDVLLTPEAQSDGEYFDSGFVDEGYVDGGYVDVGIDFGGCADCGRGVADCRGGGCGFGARGVMYVHGEYLLGWLEGMNTPPLVTQFTGIDAQTDAAIGPFTTLYGGNRILEGERHGARIKMGLWLDDYGQWGVEGEYLRLGTLEESFTAGAKDGLVPAAGMFIGRPFFNTGIIDGDLSTRGPSIEDVDTSALDGTVRVDVRSEFQSAGIRLRHNLCCREGSKKTCCGDTVGCGSDVGCGSRVSGVGFPGGPLGRLCNLLGKGVRRTDVLYGVRWTSLDESLQVTEDLQEFTSITATPPTLGDDLDVFDRFATENTFLGGEIGYETEWEYRRWSLNLLSKVAIGNTRQRVDINGETVLDNGAPQTGGLLAQRYVHPGDDGIPGNADDFVVGNIGTYERDEFSMIPELGLTMGYNLTERLKLTAGYTLIYWSNVVRPGDQIDIDVNANLIPRDGGTDSTTVVPRDHPRFEFRQTDLWAQFLRLGAEYTW